MMQINVVVVVAAAVVVVVVVVCSQVLFCVPHLNMVKVQYINN